VVVVVAVVAVAIAISLPLTTILGDLDPLEYALSRINTGLLRVEEEQKHYRIREQSHRDCMKSHAAATGSSHRRSSSLHSGRHHGRQGGLLFHHGVRGALSGGLCSDLLPPAMVRQEQRPHGLRAQREMQMKQLRRMHRILLDCWWR